MAIEEDVRAFMFICPLYQDSGFSHSAILFVRTAISISF